MSKKRPTTSEIFVAGAPCHAEEALTWERNYFAQLLLPNGLYKTTCEHRLDDVNLALLECLRGRWPNEPVSLLDIGVSSGITTLELASALRQSGRSFSIVGTDACIESTLSSYGRSFHVLRDSRRNILQFEVLGVSLGNYSGSGWQFCYRVVPVLFARALCRVLTLPGVRRLAVPESKPIRLLNRRWREEPDVTFIEEDLFTPPIQLGQYHVVRVCNVLNLSVFSQAQLTSAVQNLAARLKPDGLLIVARTRNDGTNHGTCYNFQSDGTFQRGRSFGTGCEIESVILDARFPLIPTNGAFRGMGS